jgi:hypothetical protein
MTPGMMGTADYFLDHYSTCDLGADCYWSKFGCLRTGWRGRQCKHWHPLGVRSLEELMQWMRARS